MQVPSYFLPRPESDLTPDEQAAFDNLFQY